MLSPLLPASRHMRTLVLRWLRRLGLAVLVLLVLWFAGSEVWYRKLLESAPLPNPPSRHYPAPLRQACWTELGESGSPRMQPWAMGMLPFQFGWAVARTTFSGKPRFPLTSGFATAAQLSRSRAQGNNHLRRTAISIWITRHWSAEQALDGILDQSWFGVPEIHGAAASSEVLFGQPVDSLDRRQVAMMGALLQRPHLLCDSHHEPFAGGTTRIQRIRSPGFAAGMEDTIWNGLMDSQPICKERRKADSL